MTVNERILAALHALGPPVVPGRYTGTERIYLTFNYDRLPLHYADNRPAFRRILAQVHLFCPLDENSVALRDKTMEALARADFVGLEEVDATGDDAQHFIYECETTERIV